jgi:hypothetical protein
MQANEENLQALEALVAEWARESTVRIGAMSRLAEEALAEWMLAKREGC